MLNISTSFHPHLATPNPKTPQPNLQDQTSLLLQKSHDLAWQPRIEWHESNHGVSKQNPLDITISTQIIACLEVSWLCSPLQNVCETSPFRIATEVLVSEMPFSTFSCTKECLFPHHYEWMSPSKTSNLETANLQNVCCKSSPPRRLPLSLHHPGLRKGWWGVWSINHKYLEV